MGYSSGATRPVGPGGSGHAFSRTNFGRRDTWPWSICTRGWGGTEPRRGWCPQKRERARRAGEGRRAAPGAGRSCARRQGVRRIRQSVRRRHDGAHRVLERLRRHDGVRRAADARYGLPLSAVLSGEGQGRADRPASGESRTPHGDRHRAGRRRRRDPAGTHPAARGSERRHLPARRDRELRRGPQGPGRTGGRHPGQRRDPPPAPRSRRRRAGRRGRGLRLRRRNADHLGGALSDDERPPASDRTR